MLSPMEEKAARELVGSPTDAGRAEFWQLLSVVCRLATRCEDRGDPARVGDLDHATGLPESASVLAGRSAAVGGPALALAQVIDPALLAASFVRRPDPSDPSSPGIGLETLRRAEWTAEERRAVDHLSFRVKLAVHRMAEAGWFRTRIELAEGYTLEHGDDGLCRAAKVTPLGLRVAMTLCRGTVWEGGPAGARGLREALGAERWLKAPEWAQQEARR